MPSDLRRAVPSLNRLRALAVQPPSALRRRSFPSIMRRAVALALVVLVAPSSAASTLPVVPGWVIAHGIIMVVAWLAVAPLGIAAAVMKRTYFSTDTPWFTFHYRAQMVVSLLTLVGGSIAIASYGAYNPADNAHTVMGLFLYVAVAVQVISGLVRPHVTPAPPTRSRSTVGVLEAAVPEGAPAADKTNTSVKTRARLLWEIYHKNMGRVMMAVALINIATGIHIAWQDATGSG
ncbi:hypothetical protein T492DRAFT_1070887 [Pavlovales sp. CCMP2436]|nr:hypothetical protein T492DRAFT_1070887 [Pavlovales sp. CCMP2436]